MTKTYFKYKSNRKIYSKDLSSYVTLRDIVADVQSGNDIVVLCNVTKLDVTDSVLSQAVLQKGITRQIAISLLRDTQ